MLLTHHLRRRRLLKTLALAPLASALAACGDSGLAPELDAAPALPATPPNDLQAFQHGVASGDPLAEAVILWTRVTPPAGSHADVPVTLTLARDPAMTDLLRTEALAATAARDYTVKHDATGLVAGQTYYYRFTALGQTSPTGRTRTAPRTSERLRFALASCAKFHKAHWNSYAAIAAADVDAVIHLGDYLYEESSKGEAIVGRALTPDIEVYTLAEYRDRHQFFKRDPDLQELHRQHPMIAIWDDHELADNCHYNGAHRHFEEQHGPWRERVRAAVRSYDEWMPIRTQPTPPSKEAFERIYRTLPYGDLVDVICIDARYIGRDPEVQSPSSDTQRPADRTAVNDPDRNLLGVDQREWLFEQLKGSTARYKLIANSVMFGQLHAAAGLKAAGGGTILNGDQWDGYRAEQNRVLEFIRAESIENVIVLTGDIHSAWAIDLTDDPHNPAVYQPAVGNTLAPEALRAVAVEFVCPGIGSEAGTTLGSLIPVAQQVNRHIRYAQGGEERGWVLVDVEAARAQAEWFFAVENAERNPAMASGPRWQLASGTRQLQPGGAASAARADAPRPAP